jgi:HPt (histidine-containing phosphotransfer) domain-containing protein
MEKSEHQTSTQVDRDSLPVLRTSTMDELREEGEDFLFELIELFVRETPARLALLASAVARGDRPTAERAAHTLKGTAAVFGADAMQAVAAAAEIAARAGELGEVAHMLDELQTASERVRLALLAARTAH